MFVDRYIKNFSNTRVYAWLYSYTLPHDLFPHASYIRGRSARQTHSPDLQLTFIYMITHIYEVSDIAYAWFSVRTKYELIHIIS